MEKVILLLFCLDNFRNIIQFRYKSTLGAASLRRVPQGCFLFCMGSYSSFASAMGRLERTSFS